MRLALLLCGVLSILLCRPACAGQKSVTYYLDGARVELELAARHGYLECELPESFAPGSLRVKPLGGATLQRVELVDAEDRRRARELSRLEQRKGELQVRMQSLASREEIFTAAAKSQSGKAPRKSKSNPDPLDSLKQGTEFALAQLDAVHRDRRRVQSALDSLELRIAAARKKPALARIWLSGGRASVSYLMSSQRWTPCYDLRWSGAGPGGELLLHARLPQPEKGARYLVSGGTAAQGLPARAVRGDYPTLSRYPLTLRSATGSEAPPSSFSFERVEAGLPPGEAAVFWRGEYLGSGQFPGGGATGLTIGR